MSATTLARIFAEIHVSDLAGTGFAFILLSVPILLVGLLLLIFPATRKAAKIICLIGLGVLLVGGSMCAAG
jgi:hypothetical protein